MGSYKPAGIGIVLQGDCLYLCVWKPFNDITRCCPSATGDEASYVFVCHNQWFVLDECPHGIIMFLPLSSAKVRNLFHVAMDLGWADVKIC